MSSEVSAAGADQDLRRANDRLARELAEARQQQAATAQILAAISSSPTDPHRVFTEIAASAARLCDGYSTGIFQLDGDDLRLVAHHGPITAVGPVGQGTLPLIRGLPPARAVLERQILHVADLQAETSEYPEGSDFARRLGFRAALAVPLMRADEAIGVITIRRTDARPFSGRQIELLKTFADQAVIAIENTRLFEAEQASKRELQESLEYQTATSDVLGVISRSPTELRPVLDTIARTSQRLCKADRSSVWCLVDGAFELAANSDYSPAVAQYMTRVPVPADRTSVAGRCVLEKRTLHVHDRLNEPDLPPLPQSYATGTRTLLCVPLLREGEPIGVVRLSRDEVAPFTKRQIALVETFADQAVIAIENTRLFEAEQASKREFRESLEYQTGVSDVLSVISRSKFELQPVIDTIVETATRLCEAERGAFLRFEKEGFRLVPTTGSVPGPISSGMLGRLIPFGRGSIAGRVALEASTVHVHDMQADPEITLMRDTVGDTRRTALGVPLLGVSGPIGAIVLQRTVVKPFTDRQIKLVETFADQAVIAIENTRLFEAEQASKRELQESLEYQTATSEVLSIISRSPSQLQPVFDTIVATSKRLLCAHSSIVSRVVGDEVRLAAFTPTSPEGDRELQLFYPLTLNGPGPTRAAVRERVPCIIPNIEEDDRYPRDAVKHALSRGYRSVLAVPMLHQGEAIGTINVARPIPSPFSDGEVQLLRSFADQAVIAIENTRLFEEVQARTRELTESLEYQTATSEVLGVISRSPAKEQPVLDTIVETAGRLCQADHVHVYRLRDGKYHLSAHNQTDPQIVEYLAKNLIGVDQKGSVTARAARARKTVHVPDAMKDEEYGHGPLTFSNDRTVLSVPLLREGAALGVVTVGRKTLRPFTSKEIELVETFADQAVIAIENTRLFEAEQASKRELQESLEYQTATTEVLDVISRSPTNSQPVFDAIAVSVKRLTSSSHGSVFLFDGNQIHLAAHAGVDDPVAVQALVASFPQVPDRGSATARALLSGKVAYIPDVLADDEYRVTSVANTMGYRSIVSVPMLRDGDPVGAITASAAKPAALSQRQIALLQTFANQAVIAINNAGLFEEVQARNRDLTALGEVGRAVSSTLDLKVVLKTVVNRAVELSSTDAGSIFYFRDGRFELGETTGLDEEAIERFRVLDISVGQTGLGEAIAERRPLQVADILSRPSNPLRDAAIKAGFRAALIVPLFGGEEALGALVLQRRHPGEFASAVISLMQSFAHQSAIALENARLFEQIAQKSRELEIASQHKSQFVANMSHELRTPLAAILGYAELMQEGFYEPQGKKSLDALTRIRSNGKHLLGLINTVLDIAKIESGQFSLNLGEYAVETVVETVRAATESLAETKKLALKTDVSKRLPVGLGDEQRLTQVLLNLVGNAIKFTDTGEVRITATATNSHFTVAVTDTGPGIPPQELNRVFEQFHQVDNSNTKAKGGTGLGLAIAKQIVEMHGGRIWVESTVGKGSTFQMELPIRTEVRKAAE